MRGFLLTPRNLSIRKLFFFINGSQVDLHHKKVVVKIRARHKLKSTLQIALL